MDKISWICSAVLVLLLSITMTGCSLPDFFGSSISGEHTVNDGTTGSAQSDNPESNMVTLSFSAGRNGGLKGDQTVIVKKGTPITSIAVPVPIPVYAEASLTIKGVPGADSDGIDRAATSYYFEKWEPELPDIVMHSAEYKAVFSENVTPDRAPSGFVRLLFETTPGAGANGFLIGHSFIDIRTGTPISRVPVPVPVPAKGSVFIGWEPALPDRVNALATYRAVFGKQDMK